MRKLFKGIGSAGLSLVELIISMAILAVVGVAIGGAMYASSRSYTRATAEVNVQEEAQVASNLICDWIVDAVAVNPKDDGVGGYVAGEYDEGESTGLYIIHPEGDKLMKIHVYADAADEVLKYDAVEVNSDDWAEVSGGESYSGILAKNVTGAFFYNTFQTDRNVKISVDFYFNERTYRSVTDSTSRSHDFISNGGSVVNNKPVIRFERVSRLGGAHVTLEPGQEGAAAYTFYVYIDNCGFDPNDSNYSFTVDNTGLTHTKIVSCTWNTTENRYDVVCSADKGAAGAESVSFKATAPGGTDTKALVFKIRRVTDCKFKGYKQADNTYTSVTTEGDLKVWSPKSGDNGKLGAVYESEISLGITNQADESVQGADFDKSPYNYMDPASIKVFTRSWTTNMGGMWIDMHTANAEVTVTDGVPSVKVTLTSDLEYDVYVIVVADHSGTLAGDARDNNWKLGCGCTVGTALNKPKNFGINVSYGSGMAVAGEHAYFDVIKIKKSGGYNPFTDVGGGVRRGTPACMIAFYDPTFQANLRAAIRSAYPGVTDNQIDSGTFTYKTILNIRTEYIYDQNPATGELVLRIGADGKPVKNTTGAYQKFFVYANDNLEATFHEASRRLRDQSTTIFDLDKSYDIYLEYQVWKDGVNKPELNFKTSGNVPAAVPYVYNPGNGKFRLTDSKSAQVSIPKDNNYKMGLYIEGCNFNNGHYLTARVERYVGIVNGEEKWETVNSVITQTSWTENGGDITSQIVFDNHTDTRTYPVGPYIENEFGFKNQNLEILHLNTNNLTSGGNYRLVFDTDYPCATSINYSAGTVTVGTRHYVLDTCVYFTVG